MATKLIKLSNDKKKIGSNLNESGFGGGKLKIDDGFRLKTYIKLRECAILIVKN